MRHLRKFFGAVAVSVACAFAIPANAAVLACSGGGIDLTVDQCKAAGNDHLADVEAAIAAATGVDLSLLNLVLYGKSDDNPGLFSFSPDVNDNEVKVTDWTVLNGTLIKYVTIKAAQEFKVYELPGAGASSGTGFSTAGLLTPNGRNQPDISHLSFWTVQTTPGVPEPSTWAMLLIGFGGIGFAMRRRKSSDQTAGVRIAYS